MEGREPQWRRDPFTGRWVVIAPERGQRPMLTRQVPEAAGLCPFCPGQEEHTPGEVFAIREAGAWRLRVVPNKFPALRDLGSFAPAVDLLTPVPGTGTHEVVIDCHRHILSPAEMTPSEMVRLLSAYAERLRALRATGLWASAIIFKNVGAAAGASVPHAHSQIIAGPMIAPVTRDKLVAQPELADVLRRELSLGTRVIAVTPRLILLTAFAARQPYEMLLAPRQPHAHFEESEPTLLIELADLLLDALQRLERREPGVAYNLIVHTGPWQPATEFHWHLEIIPRLATFAGYELGTGFFLNPLSPEEAAARLRE